MRRKWSDIIAASLDKTVDLATADGSLSMLMAMAALDCGHKLMHAGKIEDACKFLSLATSYFLCQLAEEDEEATFMNMVDRLADSVLDPKSAEGAAVTAAVRHMQDDIATIRTDDDSPTRH